MFAVKTKMDDYERLDYLLKFYGSLIHDDSDGIARDTRRRVRKEIEKYLEVEPKKVNG